jgi:hypothetical protein
VFAAAMGNDVFAKVWHVPADGASLSSVMEHTNDGDEVIVSPGTYNETIGFNNINVNLHSLNPTDPSVVDNTIINADPPIYVGVLATTGSRLAGFKLIGSSSSAVQGAGGKATIEYCHIVGNFGFSHQNMPSRDQRTFGGAFHQCDGLIQNNLIENNVAMVGGAFYQCNGIIQNNVIARNTVLEYGLGAGGAAFYDCGAIIRNNTIVDNLFKQITGCAETEYFWKGGGLVKSLTISYGLAGPT